MTAPIFRHQHRVTYSECTIGNHIYYSRYLDILEEARGAFFLNIGAPFRDLQEQGFIFPVIECRVRYKSPARYDDVLAVELWPTAAERIRLNFGCRILNHDGTLVLQAETHHVCTGMDDKPRRLPDELLQRLQPYLRPE